jgi:hypothetical protein
MDQTEPKFLFYRSVPDDPTKDVKTTQELMRHASSRVTLDVYAQALTPAKRSAQNKVIEIIQPGRVAIGA